MRLLTVIAFALYISSIKLLEADSAKILATLPFPNRSQYIFMEAYLKALAAKGHQVTVINAFKNEAIPNMRFIEAPKCHDYHEDYISLQMDPSNQHITLDFIFTKFMEGILEDAGVKKLLNSGETFDLVLAEIIQMEPLYAFAQHFNATLAGFSSSGTDSMIDELFGNISPVSYNPLITSSRSDRMSFKERLQNHYEKVMEGLHYHLVHLPAKQKLYVKYFPNAKLTLGEVMDSFSMVLLGQHFSLSYSRPLLPNMIEIGGLHVSHQPKALPADIKEFIESSENGVIYFSMGSNMKNKDLPRETRDTLLKTFAKLKQRVLWKFDNDEMTGKPANVLIKKWFPQPDILAHPNVKLFITHGGLLSTIESVHFGKPVLGLPCFFDQHLNIKRVRRLGYGLELDVRNLRQKDLEEAIQTLISTPSFAETAAAISERFRDQPEPSLERAIWWTEYVIRHKGAAHLRSTARDLSFIQLHSLDTWAVLLGIPILVSFILIKFTLKFLKFSHKLKKL